MMVCVVLTTRLLTEETWPDFSALIEANNGIWGGCWCMGFQMAPGHAHPNSGQLVLSALALGTRAGSVQSMVKVRAAETEDSQPIAALRATWAAEQDPAATDDPDYERAVADWMTANPRKFFVAEQDGQLIGMLNLMVFHRMPKPRRPASCWVYIGNVYVLPAQRNSGIGAQLMEAAISYSQGIDAARIVLSPSTEAQSFYQRLSFEPAGELSVRRLWRS